MTLHVLELLAAYHDGELTPTRQRLVEKHLQDCAECRAELDAIQELSSLLKADPMPPQTSPQRFAAQVQLRLPRALPSHARQNGELSSRWVLGVPLALVLVWAFLEAAIRVTAFVLTADNVFGVALFNGWISTEGLLETNASLLVFEAILLMGMTILWSAWMAFWLAWEKNRTNNLQKEV